MEKSNAADFLSTWDGAKGCGGSAAGPKKPTKPAVAAGGGHNSTTTTNEGPKKFAPPPAGNVFGKVGDKKDDHDEKTG
jgi:hypothetical protein